MSEDYNLTCWYINKRRILELIGTQAFLPALARIDNSGEDQNFQEMLRLTVFKEKIAEWLASQKPKTLGEIIVSDTLKEGAIFTYYTNYYFKGLGNIQKNLTSKKNTVPLAEAYAKLEPLLEGWRLSFQFHHEHLTSNSAWSWLSGQQTMLLVGVISKISNNVIEAIPYVIANPLPDMMSTPTTVGGHWSTRFEVFVDNIDTFKEIKNVKTRASKKQLERLKNVPEEKVKKAFSSIIGEPVIPKDWGGERSDLFTSRVYLRGERISTAFAFKGPAKFQPMTLATLGKNGDQIDRLFSEPADLLVLQHCHEITPAVRGAMRAYAQRMGNLRLFCLIDGYDTVRLMDSYPEHWKDE